MDLTVWGVNDQGLKAAMLSIEEAPVGNVADYMEMAAQGVARGQDDPRLAGLVREFDRAKAHYLNNSGCNNPNRDEAHAAFRRAGWSMNEVLGLCVDAYCFNTMRNNAAQILAAVLPGLGACIEAQAIDPYIMRFVVRFGLHCLLVRVSVWSGPHFDTVSLCAVPDGMTDTDALAVRFPRGMTTLGEVRTFDGSATRPCQWAVDGRSGLAGSDLHRSVSLRLGAVAKALNASRIPCLRGLKASAVDLLLAQARAPQSQAPKAPQAPAQLSLLGVA